MAMPVRAPHRPWTEDEFYTARDAAPPGERWELVDGEVLVAPLAAEVVSPALPARAHDRNGAGP